MFYKPFKGRGVEIGEMVDVYRNLHTDNGYSIRSVKTGLVLAHCTTVTLKNCTFVVQEAGRQKTIQEKRKRVHAFVRGELTAINEIVVPEEKEVIYYNPYYTEKFMLQSMNIPLAEASVVHCQGKYCYM